MDTLEILKQLEIELHQPGVCSDIGRLSALLHDSFKECGRSGRVYDRSEVLNEVSMRTDEFSVWSQDFEVNEISDDLALLTYKSAHINPDGSLSRHSFRSSLWHQTINGWQMRYHQGTPLDVFVQNSD